MADTSDLFDPSSFPTCQGEDNDHLLGLRIGGLFGILAIGAFGITVPYLTYTPKANSVYFCLRAFAAGVVLATGYTSCQCSLAARGIMLVNGICIAAQSK